MSLLSLAVALAAGMAAPALAQNAPSAQDGPPADSATVSEVVVTGTLIRGNVQNGSQVLSYGGEDLKRAGASDPSELLATIPQDNSFASRPRTGTFGQYQTVNRPTLRFLGGGSSGGSSTLVLLDGHRMPGMGVLQTTPDVDAIAMGAIERVEIVTEGGSSTYGADAVGGVMNFITRKRFDGFEASGHYGIADNYWQWDVSATAGKIWDKGSIWGSYNFSKHDILYGRDRDYVHKTDYTAGGSPADYTCNPANVLSSGSYYTFTGPNTFTPGATRCDTTKATALFPSERRHSGFVGLNYDLSDNITLDVRGFILSRRALGDGGPLIGNVTLRPLVDLTAVLGFPFAYPNPYYRVIPGAPAGAPQTVSFDFSDVLGDHSYTTTKTDSWGATETLTARLGGDWQATGFFNYGESKASAVTVSGVDTTALATAEFLGQFNPYNLSDPANATLIEAFRDRRGVSVGRNKLTNGRVVADGPLFTLPGGELRIAIGAEIMREDYELQNGAADVDSIDTIPNNKSDRTTKAVFGELSLPIFGEDNRRAGFHSLTLSASGRYDHYSDFGGTFDPKLGASWQPVEWWTLRGSWGKSFQAPSLSDGQEASPPQFIAIPGFVLFADPSVPALPGQGQAIVLGGGSDLKPQKATTWQLGTDIKPPSVPGLSIGLTYYNIDFKDRLSAPPFFDSRFYAQYPGFYKIYNGPGGITSADLAALANISSDPSTAAQFIANPALVYSLIDARNTNLSRVKTDGLDFAVNYRRPTSFGALYGGVIGSYILSFKEQPTAGAPVNDTTDVNPRLRLMATLGAEVSALRGSVTLQHTGGFDVTPTAANLNQSRVKSFDTVNVFLEYAVAGEGALKDLSFTLNVDNLFDTDPASYNGTYGQSAGYVGFTLGRLVQVGVRKQF